jgi:hypothetical protein
VDKDRKFVQIYSFTAGCNWLDVVEVKFRLGKDSGNDLIDACGILHDLDSSCPSLALRMGQACGKLFHN